MNAENRLLAKFPKSELEALRPHMETLSLGHGDSLIKPREAIAHVYFPLNALASLVTMLEDGSSVESGSVGREGMVGVPIILDADTTPMQTLIQIPGELIRVKASAIKECFVRSRAVQSLLNRYVHMLFVVASQSAACNRKHQVAERLARWLLASSDGIASEQVNLTHEFLATMLGVRRAGVTEAAQALQERGLIEYKRGGVRIIDRNGLEAAACECYGIVRAEIERLLT
jgi:CRP-like cAMP-binding protein